MTAASLAARPLPGALAQLSTRAVFFVAGLGMAAWAPLVPFAKARLALEDDTLGALLLCLGAGSLIAMPLSGSLTARFGCRRVVRAASLGICIALPALAAAPNIGLLAAALLLFGATVGSLDVAINTQAVIVEKAAGRALMSGFHGLFSLGGVMGSAGVSALLWAGASPLAAALCVVAAIVGLILGPGAHLLAYGSEGDGPSLAWPRGPVLLIGALCFVLFLTEGAMLDWSAVFLTSVRDASPSSSGLGYAVFALAMTAGRLTGDRIVRALGGRRVLVVGSLCAAGGLAFAILAPSWWASLVGFGLVGAGASNTVPVLYSQVGRQRAMPSGLAVAAITTLGYAGILAGPALIGLAARVAGLPSALMGVAALLVVVAACGRLVVARG